MIPNPQAFMQDMIIIAIAIIFAIQGFFMLINLAGDSMDKDALALCNSHNYTQLWQRQATWYGKVTGVECVQTINITKVENNET